jgi:short subunit dehydrogenase-like uncharacterized protein
MPGRIVLYGATGFTGALTAAAMVASGARPILAGRDQSRLSALAARISPADDGVELETVVASAEALRELIGVGDVLVSTAGPSTWTPPGNRPSSARCLRSSARELNEPARYC